MTRFLSQLLFLSTVVSINSIAMADDAATLLTDMAKKISSTNTFSVTLLIRYDALQESGQLIEFSERREMILRRPEGLRVDVRQSDGDEGGLVINSSTITQFNLSEAVYSQLDRSGNVDASIRYAVAKLGVRFPLARLLVASLPEEMAERVTRVDFVESVQLGDVPLEHIAAVGPEVDSQFWIREDKLPARIVLTYRNAPGQPRFSADFIDWNLAPELGPETFQYVAPPGAERIPVLIRNTPSDREIAE
jgi:hypothetical protein